ncbi:MAG: CopG family transcriptional regulator [Thermoprotei archaeon]|nr:MAG: CopG family transcriptional regulator [Thermoprotei archaeon]
MSVTVSFRIPRDLRAKMRLYSDRVNWSEEVRRFIERRVGELERERALKELEEPYMEACLPMQGDRRWPS